MKHSFLKLDNPCDEKWGNMTPTEKGRFCDLCSKNVIDFTNLSHAEILKIIKKSNGNICARVNPDQLNVPLIGLGPHKEYSFPFSNIAAGIMIASTLTASQTLHAEEVTIQTEYVQNTDSKPKAEKNESKTNPDKLKASDGGTLTFKGTVNSKDDGSPIENAKITFVTVQKVYSAYSQKDGTFSLDIPNEWIDDDNVISVSYNDIVESKEQKSNFCLFRSADYILSKKDIASDYTISAISFIPIKGGLKHYVENYEPIVYVNGERIEYEEYIEASGKKKYYQNKNSYHFDSKEAFAILGEKAKDGLIILFDKPEK